MLAWITPTPEPGDQICIKLWLPSGIDYEACVKGALLSLTEVENWEQVTGQTPEVVADAFFETFDKTLDWRPCLPVGTVLFGAWADPPPGFLECDETSYPVADYPALFAVIGYTYGGSGANFQVPKLNKRVVSGKGSGISLGQYYGNGNTYQTEARMATHNHGLPATLGLGSGVGPVPILISSPLIDVLQSGNAGSGDLETNHPYTLGLTACISYE